jgi:hypothetical protein
MKKAFDNRQITRDLVDESARITRSKALKWWDINVLRS